MSQINRPFLALVSALLLSVACSIAPSLAPQISSATPPPKSSNTSIAPKVSSTTSPSESSVTSISAGGTHVCALFSNGEVMCWGDNTSGQLGDGTYKPQPLPVRVRGLGDAIGIAAGGAFTCAITKSEGVKCWGDNHYGQLGDGTRTMSNIPVSVTGLAETVTAITAGLDHTCVITSNGQAKCWGKNLYGRLGDGSNSQWSKTPVDVIDLGGIAIGITASNEHTCILISSGGIQCWGSNSDGQLGITENKKFSKRPVNVFDLETDVSVITTGYSKSCAIMGNGNVECWGWIGSDLFSDLPLEVNGLNNVIAIAAGGGHICAVIQDDGIKCLGENTSGQLGNGTNSDSFTPVNVEALNGSAKSVVANFDFTCVLMNNGDVKCWGDNTAGQLGNGTKESSSVPVDVQGLIQKY